MFLKQVILQVHEGNEVVRRVAIPPPETFNTVLKMLRKYYEIDYPTANFFKFLTALFNGAGKGSSVGISLIDTAGSTITRVIYINTTYYTSAFNNTYNGECIWLIGVGSGTTPPSSDDYELEALISKIQASAGQVGDSVYISALFSFSTDTTVSEVGLYARFVGVDFLMDRTVLGTPITVSAGQTLSVAYRFALMT